MDGRPDDSAGDAQWTPDAARWELVRRDPEYREDHAKLRTIETKLENDTAMTALEEGDLHVQCTTLREKMRDYYRLLDVADPEKQWSDFGPALPLSTSFGIVEVVHPDNYGSDDARRLPPILRVLEGNRLTLCIDMSQPKSIIMTHLEERIDATLAAMKSERWVEETRRRPQIERECIEIFDMRKAGMTFTEIARKYDETRLAATYYLDETTVRRRFNRARELIEEGGHRRLG